MQEQTKKTLRSAIIIFLICAIVMGGAFYFSRNYLVVFPIDGDSMESTIHDHDYALVFRTKKLKYDDIFIFYQTSGARYLVKRVIGLEGDKIEIKYSIEEGLYHVYRNGEMLSESYINEPMTVYEELSVIVPKDKIFFLGDNRLHSYDSHHGNVYADISEVQGKVFVKYKGWDIKFI